MSPESSCLPVGRRSSAPGPRPAVREYAAHGFRPDVLPARVGKVRVNLQREQPQRVKTLRIDNRHIVGGADGRAGEICPALQPMYSAPRFTTSTTGAKARVHGTLSAAESIASADNHHFSGGNRRHRVGDAVNTGDGNAKRGEHPAALAV